MSSIPIPEIKIDWNSVAIAMEKWKNRTYIMVWRAVNGWMVYRRASDGTLRPVRKVRVNYQGELETCTVTTGIYSPWLVLKLMEAREKAEETRDLERIQDMTVHIKKPEQIHGTKGEKGKPV